MANIYTDMENNSFFAKILERLVLIYSIQNYKGISDFIEKHKFGRMMIPLDEVRVTPEITKFAKLAKNRNYKYKNKSLKNFLNKAINDGNCE